MNNRLPVEELVEIKEFRREITRQINLPVDLPDIDEIIDSGAQIEVIRVETESGEVELDAVIQLFITYRPEGNGQRIITYQRTTEFDQSFDFPEARRGMESDVEISVGRVTALATSQRRVRLTIPATYQVQLFKKEDIKYLVKEDGYKIVTRPYKIQQGIKEEEREVTISVVKTLPEEIEDSRDIISSETEIIVNNVETRRDLVVIKGEIITTIIYVTEAGRIVSRELRSYYQQRINILGVRSGMEGYAEGVLLRQDSIFQRDNRVKFNYKVLFKILIIEEQEIELPVRVIDPDRYYDQVYVVVERRVKEEKTKFLVSDSVIIPDNQPPASKVIKSSAQIGELNVDRLDDGVIVDGTGEINHLYVSTSPDQPVYAIRDRFSFSQFVEIDDLTEKNRVYAEVRVDKIRASLEDEREIESRIILEFKLLVTELVRIPVVVEGNGREQKTYIVKSGDSLWSIARKFNTTIEELVELNDITASQQLMVGQELLIPVT